MIDWRSACALRTAEGFEAVPNPWPCREPRPRGFVSCGLVSALGGRQRLRDADAAGVEARAGVSAAEGPPEPPRAPGPSLGRGGRRAAGECDRVALPAAWPLPTNPCGGPRSFPRGRVPFPLHRHSTFLPPLSRVLWSLKLFFHSPSPPQHLPPGPCDMLHFSVRLRGPLPIIHFACGVQIYYPQPPGLRGLLLLTPFLNRRLPATLVP